MSGIRRAINPSEIPNSSIGRIYSHNVGIPLPRQRKTFELYDQLLNFNNFEIEARPHAGDADLLVRNPNSGKTVAIELKDVGDYGKLPISNIIPIAGVAQNSNFEKFWFITSSNVPLLLSKKLQALNVEALRPTVSPVVEKVQYVLIGRYTL